MTAPPADRAIQIHAALAKAGLGYTALSWNGFNLFGTRRDIAEVERLLSCEARMESLQAQLMEARPLPAPQAPATAETED